MPFGCVGDFHSTLTEFGDKVVNIGAAIPSGANKNNYWAE